MFYLRRFERVADARVPIEVEGGFSSVYNPDQIFKSRSACLDGDVSFALSRIAKASDEVSQEDRETYQRWEDGVRNVLKDWLVKGWYDDQHSFALECEVEYRCKMISRGFPVLLRDGEVSAYHRVNGIRGHLKSWKLPDDVGARMKQIEDWSRAQRKDERQKRLK